MLLRIRMAGVVFIQALLLLGCASPHISKTNFSCRLAEVDSGVSVFRILINGKEFEHRSPTGLIELFADENRNILKVKVDSEDSRGTYVGGEIEHYYHIGEKGQVTYLGSLKESWYENEDLIRVKTDGFKHLVIP